MTQTYTIAGVENAIIADPPFGKVIVKTLTKEQIYQYFKDEERLPLNTTLLYYNPANLDLALELLEEGKLRWRECQGAMLEIPPKAQSAS